MADELKEIQVELDSVLGRLAEYMNNDDSKTVSYSQHYNLKDAARVALHYVTTETSSLDHSIRMIGFAKERPALYHSGSRLEEITHESSNNLYELQEALSAVVRWKFISCPLEDEHMETLSEAVMAWSLKECQFIGENFGLELSPKRQLQSRKRMRQKAASEAFKLHISDPRNFPVDGSLFDEVGKRYSMSSRTVSRTYYSQFNRRFREAYKQFLRDNN